MPRMYEMDGYVLELKRNLYGGVASGANFFNLLKEQLEKRGFEPSEEDPCLFMNKKTGCIILTYVDDCILFHKDESVIDAVLKDLETPNLPIFEKNKNNTRPINFALTPDADSFSKLPPESQPSPSNLKRKG